MYKYTLFWRLTKTQAMMQQRLEIIWVEKIFELFALRGLQAACYLILVSGLSLAQRRWVQLKAAIRKFLLNTYQNAIEIKVAGEPHSCEYLYAKVEICDSKLYFIQHMIETFQRIQEVISSQNCPTSPIHSTKTF